MNSAMAIMTGAEFNRPRRPPQGRGRNARGREIALPPSKVHQSSRRSYCAADATAAAVYCTLAVMRAESPSRMAGCDWSRTIAVVPKGVTRITWAIAIGSAGTLRPSSVR